MGEITIPEKFQNLGRDLAILATKYGLSSMKATLSPQYDEEWRADIHFLWENGRHDEDVGRFRLTSEFKKSVVLPWEDIEAAVEERRQMQYLVTAHDWIEDFGGEHG